MKVMGGSTRQAKRLFHSSHRTLVLQFILAGIVLAFWVWVVTPAALSMEETWRHRTMGVESGRGGGSGEKVTRVEP